MKLSPEQQDIVNIDKNVIVVSNPGTGKTTTLASRVLKILESGTKPEDILCITFTEKAKKEMFDTIHELGAGKFDDAQLMKINIHTFHSFAYNYLLDAGLIAGDIIGNNFMRFSLLKSFERRNAFNYGKDYMLSDIVPKTENAIRYIKSFGLTPDKIDAESVKSSLEVIYEDSDTSYTIEELLAFVDYFLGAYADYENTKESIDYSDMLLLFLEKYRGEQFEYVLVDEMQDMNGLEAEIAEKVGKKLFLVGDSKQAIFGFQGGSIKNFMKFKKKCQAKLLSTNRRSTQPILDYSKNHFLSKTSNKEMFKEELECFNSGKKGLKPKIIATNAKLRNTLEIIKTHPKNTVGIITRTNKQLLELSEFLDMNNITYASTSSKATTMQARDEIIRFLRGLLLDDIEDKISATFSVFAPYTLKESFELSEMHKNRKDVTAKLKRINDMGIDFDRAGIDNVFNKLIFPVCISKGPEWFPTAILIKNQIDEYLTLKTPLKQDFFDFLSVTEEAYAERNSEANVMLTTVHKAKGRDFDIVVYIPSSTARTSFMDLVVEAVLDSKDIKVKEEMAEESLRVDFVAFTRAKEKLFILTDDKSSKNYHLQDLNELEVDDSSEELVATKMNSKMAEAFALFVAGRFEDSKSLLNENDQWLEDFIVNYFTRLEYLSFSNIDTDPFIFLKQNIIAIPQRFAATDFGSSVHTAIADIFGNKPQKLEGDVEKAVSNAQKAIDQLKKEFPGLTQIYAEKRLKVPLSVMTDTKENMIFKGFLDTVFKHDDGYIIVDWKTDKSTNYAANSKQQVAVYRRMLSAAEKIPENKIKTFVVYVSLRGSINTGRFDWSIEKESRNPYQTFEKHLQTILEWKKDPKTFIKDLLEKPVDDVLYEVIVEKLGK